MSCYHAIALLFGSLIGTAASCQTPLQFKAYSDGLTAYHQGEFAAATKLLKQAVTDVPRLQMALALTALGEVWEEIGDVKMAEQCMRQADGAGPGSSPAYARLSGFYLRNHQPKRAVELCQQALLSNYHGVQRAVVEVVYAEALIAINRVQQGEAAMTKALASMAADPNVYPWEFGWALVRSAKIADTRGDFRRAVAQSEEAVKFAQLRWGEYSPLTLASLELYGSSLAKVGEIVKGRKILEGVLSRRREVYLESSPAIRATKARLNTIVAP